LLALEKVERDRILVVRLEQLLPFLIEPCDSAFVPVALLDGCAFEVSPQARHGRDRRVGQCPGRRRPFDNNRETT
jgi:hypothetical protein